MLFVSWQRRCCALLALHEDSSSGSECAVGSCSWESVLRRCHGGLGGGGCDAFAVSGGVPFLLGSVQDLLCELRQKLGFNGMELCCCFCLWFWCQGGR